MRSRLFISVMVAAGLVMGIGGFAWSGVVTASDGEPQGWVTYSLDETEPVGEPQVGGASVIGQDDRTRTYDSKVHPFRNTAFLISTFGQGYITSCTGTMIDHNVLVTAAHCLFDPQRNIPAMSVQVRPGQDGDVLPYGVAYATKFSVSTGFVPGSLPGTPQDFALVHLEGKPFEEKLGPFVPLFAPTNGDLNPTADTNLWTIGYPGEKPLGTVWQTKGKINSFTSSVIFTQMDITGGQSGSASYLIDNATGTYRQVGIVSFGSSTMNGIVRFSAATIASMEEWCVTYKCTVPTGDAMSLTVTPTRTPTKTPTRTPTSSQTSASATATPSGTAVPSKPFRLFAGSIASTK